MNISHLLSHMLIRPAFNFAYSSRTTVMVNDYIVIVNIFAPHQHIIFFSNVQRFPSEPNAKADPDDLDYPWALSPPLGLTQICFGSKTFKVSSWGHIVLYCVSLCSFWPISCWLFLSINCVEITKILLRLMNNNVITFHTFSLLWVRMCQCQILCPLCTHFKLFA